MNNVSNACNNKKVESPKTPGGISKALLTPCRRLGLSRNWKKKGPSPFVSPLAREDLNDSKNVITIASKKEIRKRKKNESEETSSNLEETFESQSVSSSYITNTPTRLIEHPRKKKKGLYITVIDKENTERDEVGDRIVTTDKELNETEEDVHKIEQNNENLINCNITYTNSHQLKTIGSLQNNEILPTEKNHTATVIEKNKDIHKHEISSEIKDNKKTENIEVTKHSTKNKSSKILSPANTLSPECSNLFQMQPTLAKTEVTSNITEMKDKKSISNKQKSPNNLTKECIVVIQNKMLKKMNKNNIRTNNLEIEVNNVKENLKEKGIANSQNLFDSDGDDVPLSKLSKGEVRNNKQKLSSALDIDIDDDFESTNNKIKVKKLDNKQTSTSELRINSKRKHIPKKNIKTQVQTVKDSQNMSENFFIDDDDDFVANRKTILIRKSYDKVVKPQKAKSTGSITQNDIDELKSRILIKKKLLLAKCTSKETEELRALIKNWQKGCQEALMELLDLMKTKFPDRHNMDYSEILQMLKIPAELVGYNSENDSFLTPTDENIILPSPSN